MIESTSSDQIEVFPNPTRSSITIIHEQEDKNPIQEIIIFSITGEKFLSSFKNFKISLEGLPHGFYFIKVRLTDNQFFVRKIIKVGG